MARILFEMPPSGYRSVRGQIIKDLQVQLGSLGYNPGAPDGIFGGKTRNAVQAWQRANDIPASGAVDETTWEKVMGGPIPTIASRSLQLTADFEGHSFTLACGNFDGAWLTWGIIGFTLKHGEVEAIIQEVQGKHPDCLDQAFGLLKRELLEVMSGSAAEKEAWANRISIGRLKEKIEEKWADAFARLGEFKEVQAIQLERVKAYYERAMEDAAYFNLTTEAGYSLCFDIAVQNGGVDNRERSRIDKELQKDPPSVERDKLTVIARVVAESSKPAYVKDVMRRKMTIATGGGEVHQARYRVSTWGIADLPV